MPVTQYDANNYIKKLLTNIKIDFVESDIDQYMELITYSIGFNPRNLKRAFNCLLLLNLVAQQNDLFAQIKTKNSDIQRIIFGCICMQSAYEPLYNYLSRNINIQTLNKLKDTDAYKNGELKSILDNIEYGSSQELANFMAVFCEVIRLDKQDEISELALSTLKVLLAFSGVTAANDAQENPQIDFNLELRRENKRIANFLCDYLPETCPDFFSRVGVKKLQSYQSRGAMWSIVICSNNSEKALLGEGIQLWQTPRDGNSKTFRFEIIGLKEEAITKLRDVLRGQLAGLPDVLKNLLFEYNDYDTNLFTIYRESFAENVYEKERQERIKYVAANIFNALAKA
jgi:hypothetical protein